jgi:hypothetical protein
MVEKRIKRTSIYQVIKTALTDADRALSAPDLMDVPEVRTTATEHFGKDAQIAINKLSDALGHLWRRGSIERYPASVDGSKARFVYGPKHDARQSEPIPPPPNVSKKPVFNITESSEEITLDFEYFTLIVRKR